MANSTEQMRDHWWWRPGWRIGRSAYTWHITFPKHPEIKDLAGHYSTLVGRFPSLDPVPISGLHLTVQGGLTVSELAEICAQLSVRVELFDSSMVRGAPCLTPLDLASDVKFHEEVQAVYLGALIRNDGLVTVGVDTVGIDLDVGCSVGLYQFTTDQPYVFSKEVKGQCSSGPWLAHPETILRGIAAAMHRDKILHHSRIPVRLRGYASLGSGTRIEGEWLPFRTFAELARRSMEH